MAKINEDQWTRSKLTRWMITFDITQKKLSEGSGVSLDAIQKFLYGDRPLNGHGEKISAYFESLREAKKAELKTMMLFFENYN
jgi:predicted transcriptional regulator